MAQHEPTSDEASRRGQPRPRHLLLVEDNDDSIVLLRMLLERRGFVVTTARTVAAARAAAAAAPIDVLLSDIGLPDGSGRDLLQQLRAAGPLPAIAISGLVRASDIESARAAGFDEYLSKPVAIDQLVAAVDRVSGG